MRKNESFGGLALCKSALGKKLVDDGVLMTKEEEKLGLVHDSYNTTVWWQNFWKIAESLLSQPVQGLMKFAFLSRQKNRLTRTIRITNDNRGLGIHYQGLCFFALVGDELFRLQPLGPLGEIHALTTERGRVI